MIQKTIVMTAVFAATVLVVGGLSVMPTQHQQAYAAGQSGASGAAGGGGGTGNLPGGGLGSGNGAGGTGGPCFVVKLPGHPPLLVCGGGAGG